MYESREDIIKGTIESINNCLGFVYIATCKDNTKDTFVTDLKYIEIAGLFIDFILKNFSKQNIEFFIEAITYLKDIS